MLTSQLLMVSLVAVLTGHPQPRPAPPPAKPRLDPIYAMQVTRTGLIVTVPSNGCTRKEDFAARTSGPGRNAVIGFYRKRMDACRSLVAAHAELRYTFAELALTPNVKLKLLNELTADPSPQGQR